MNEQIKEYLEKFSCEVTDLFHAVRSIIFDAAPIPPQETLWAKLPSYYVGTSFVRLIAFKDHINIEATVAVNHKDDLMGYQMTPKGMLQIFIYQEIPVDVLKQIFAETFGS